MPIFQGNMVTRTSKGMGKGMRLQTVGLKPTIGDIGLGYALATSGIGKKI